MQRHDLAWLKPGAAVRFLCGIADAALAARVADWTAAGRPLVVARQPAGADGVLLGLTLPASEGRRRLGCLVDRRDILRTAPPLAIGACLRHLPDAVAVPLARLETRLFAGGVRVGVYGSLAWEAASGETYRHAGSDVDLICDVDSSDRYALAIAALTDAAAGLPCGLDGEIRFPDGCAVAWKELAAAGGNTAARVLVKGAAEVALLPVGDLLAQFDEECCHA